MENIEQEHLKLAKVVGKRSLAKDATLLHNRVELARDNISAAPEMALEQLNSLKGFLKRLSSQMNDDLKENHHALNKYGKAVDKVREIFLQNFFVKRKGQGRLTLFYYICFCEFLQFW